MNSGAAARVIHSNSAEPPPVRPEPSWFLDAANDQPHDLQMARYRHTLDGDGHPFAAHDFGGEDVPFRQTRQVRPRRWRDAAHSTAHRTLPRRRTNDPETAAALQSDRSTLMLTLVATLAGLVIGFGATQISRFSAGTETAAIQPAPVRPAQPVTARAQVPVASETIVQKAPAALAAPEPMVAEAQIPPPRAAASAGLQQDLALQIPDPPEAADPLVTGSPPPAEPPPGLSDDPLTPSPIPQPVSTGVSLPDAPVADSTTIAQGNVMLEAGDAEAAREFYLAAYKAGQSAAALGMARSYDPMAHAQYQVNNGKPDRALALKWYERAAKAGQKQAFAAIARLKTKQ